MKPGIVLARLNELRLPSWRVSAVLLLARRFGWKPILSVSVFFWFLAQFGFRSAEHNFMMHYIPTNIPIHEMGSFDLWA